MKPLDDPPLAEPPARRQANRCTEPEGRDHLGARGEAGGRPPVSMMSYNKREYTQ